MSGPTVDWLVLCEQVLQDQGSRRLTLVNALDQVPVLRVPVLHPQFAVAAQLHWDGERPADARYDYRIVRFSDSDAEEPIFQATSEWPDDRSHMKLFQNYGVLRIRAYGTLWFRLDLRVAGSSRWRKGTPVPVGVVPVPLSDEERAELDQRWAALRESVESP